MYEKNNTFAGTLPSVTVEEFIYFRLTNGRSICVYAMKVPLFFILLPKFLFAVDMMLSCHFVNLFTI